MADKDGIKDGKDFGLGTPARNQPFFVKGAGALDWGMQNGLARIVNPDNGRTVMLAVDHGYVQGPTGGIERSDLQIVPVIPHADVLMCTRGALRTSIPEATDKPVVLRCSAGQSVLSELSNELVAVDIEDAIRLNAAAMAAQVYIGAEYEHESIANVIELIDTGEYTYPQPWYHRQRGFLFLLTKYLGGRQLFFKTSADGRSWSEDTPLAAFGGHYQLSWQRLGRVATAFNWHPGGVVDKRTNLYFAQTTDGGRSWHTAGGTQLTLPLAKVENDALIRDYQAEGKLCYLNDLKFDTDGNPVILHVVVRHWRPGPDAAARTWAIARWDSPASYFNRRTSSIFRMDNLSWDISSSLLG